jgi:outer membrane protein assembly factor BamB
VVTTLAGKADTEGFTDGTGSAARFNHPFGVAVASDGTLYVADETGHLIRKVTPSGVVTTLAGSAGNRGSADGTGTTASFNYPQGVAVASDGTLYVADRANQLIRKIGPPGSESVVVTKAISAGASLQVTMGGTLKAAKEAHVTCTDNLAANGAVGDVTFGISTSSDTEPLGGQTGYTITPV